MEMLKENILSLSLKREYWFMMPEQIYALSAKIHGIRTTNKFRLDVTKLIIKRRNEYFGNQAT